MDADKTRSKILNITVRDRNGTLFQGQADAISSFNAKGPFDILGQHANFITLIQKAIIVHQSGKPEKRIELASGVAKVRDNNVEVYLGILR